MPKILGIITLIGYYNYGNRLQNYAVQEVLHSLGCNCETIINLPTNIILQNRIKKVLNTPFPKLIKIVLMKLNLKNKSVVPKTGTNTLNVALQNFDISIERERASRQFTKENIEENTLNS